MENGNNTSAQAEVLLSIRGISKSFDGTLAVDNVNLDIHKGLDRPPLTRSNEAGTWVVLASTNAKGMTEGAPIYYRGLPVGRMQNLRLSEKDENVLADVFIAAPHDQRLTTATVFWDDLGQTRRLVVQTLVAPRLGDDPDPDREPEQSMERP